MAAKKSFNLLFHALPYLIQQENSGMFIPQTSNSAYQIISDTVEFERIITVSKIYEMFVLTECFEQGTGLQKIWPFIRKDTGLLLRLTLMMTTDEQKQFICFIEQFSD
jgi:hypothetical protein